jgi:hypothetical protein
MNRTNRILSVVLLLQIGAVMAVALTRDRGGIARSEPVFPGLTASQVSRIEVQGPKGVGSATTENAAAVLEKDGATWRVSGSGYPADAKKVEKFLADVGQLVARGPVVTSTKHQRTLEVADEAYERKVKLVAADKPVGFYLGKAAGPAAVHLRKDGSSDVLRVEGLDVWSVGDRASQWIDPVYVKVEPSDVWGLTVEGKKGTFKLEKGDGGAWRLADLGKGEETNVAAVEELVRSFSSMNLEEPVGRTAGAETGLATPAIKITLETGKPDGGGKRPAQTKPLTLTVGQGTEAGRYYAKSSESDFVVKVAEWTVKPLLAKTRGDLVKKR